jgi:hypothetical protein
MSASASRRDDTDRSLARSAWKNATQKNRPVGYGMIRYEGRPGRLSRTLNTQAGRIPSNGEEGRIPYESDVRFEKNLLNIPERRVPIIVPFH